MRNIMRKRISREEARRGVKRSVKELVRNRIDEYGINILVNNNMSNGVLKMMRILKDNYEEVEETKYEIKKGSLHKVNWNNLVSDSDVSYVLINAYEEEEEMDMEVDEIANILSINKITKVVVERYNDNLTIYFYERSIRLAFASDFETLDKFEGYNWNHGLLAFNNGDPVKNLASLLNHSEWEICCSFDGQYIGPVGISVTGETKIASNMDLFSEIEDEGRCFDTTSYRANYLINTPDDIDTTICHHGEGIVTNIEVTKVWVKEYWYEENAHIVDELCEIADCSFIII